jgi:phosphoglucosamine mutase
LTVRKLFGTDGIRGTANAEPMTAETAMKVAAAAGRHFTRGVHGGRVVIGKDTRLSGYLLEPALTAGFISIGMDVMLIGPLPTPAIAMLTRSLRADLGVVISASHNVYSDNGIKLFGPDGCKLSDDIELAIERGLDSRDALAAPDQLGRAKRIDDAAGRYIEFVKATFPKGLRLNDLRIVVDCANGAAYKVAPTVLWELGAEVISIGVNPDGFNINKDCGATHPAALQEQVKTYRADLGIALDGDADRLLMIDENGRVIDGDQVMAVIARSWHESGRLRGGGVVGTVMSNLGLERCLEGQGLRLARAAVGDRYVFEMMREQNFNVGGEQSGHLILSDYATTGDGLVAALQVLAVLVQSGQRASDICRVFEPMPQLLRNVRFNGGQPLDAQPVKDAIRDAQSQLGTKGRVLVRKSGTEPLIRVMVEGEDQGLIGKIADGIIREIQRVA